MTSLSRAKITGVQPASDQTASDHTSGAALPRAKTGVAAAVSSAVLWAAIGAAAFAAPASARETVRVVGSSTVFPFAQAVAEQYGARAADPTPVVEATGTGGGVQLFCSGVGEEFPDVVNASRRLKANEWQTCQANGVDEIVEVQIGYDGIVFANTKQDPSAPVFVLSRRHVFDALAAQLPTSDTDCTLRPNPYEVWSQISPELPDVEIEVYGPPPTSGTRDAFVEIAMEGGAKTYGCLRDLRETDEMAFRDVAHRLREDGFWIDAGENDNALVNLLLKAPSALGVFGFSFLDQNSDRMRGASVDGAAPTFENIASGEYPVSRSLFFYLKKEHLDLVSGLRGFADEFVSEAAAGPFGYLAERGLIPLPDDERAAMADRVAQMTTLTADIFEAPDVQASDVQLPDDLPTSAAMPADPESGADAEAGPDGELESADEPARDPVPSALRRGPADGGGD